MRKAFTFLFVALSFGSTLLAQTDCGGGRYISEVFAGNTRTNNVTYGANTNLQGQNQSLEMDIWEPLGDNEPLRPILVLAHGGSFVGGSKDAVDITSLAGPLTKRGFVISSIEYRLGMAGLPFPGPDSIDASTSVWRAVADFKAAVRFLYKSAQNGNPYRIDTTRLYIGGVSAGAVAAVHYAYLDDINEMPSYIDTTLAGTGGGIEGNSGNPGYSSKAHGVINICGMIADTAWMSPGDEPIVSLHGTADDVVPYGSAIISVAGFYPIFVVDGSSSITAKANELGLDNCFWTHLGAGHTPHINTQAYLDTTVNYVSNFMYHLVCGGSATCDPLSARADALPIGDVTLFPNPAYTRFELQIAGAVPTEWDYSLLDMTGRVLKSGHEIGTDRHRFEREGLAAGIYLIRVTGEGLARTERVVLR